MTARTLSILLLSFALVAPAARLADAAGAKAPARQAKKKAKPKAKARARVKPRAKPTAGAKGDRGSRLRLKLFGKKAAAKKKQAKQPNALAKRQIVRDRQAATKSQLKTGQMAKAAGTATQSLARGSNGQFIKGAVNKLTVRERFAMWRNARKVTKAARKQVRTRSKNGDVQGTKDALSALKTLEKGGRIGVIGRWRNARAGRRAFKNSVKQARKAMREGDVQRSGELQQFASGLRGGTRAERRALRKLSKDAVKLAKTYAKQGNPEATWQALQMSVELTTMAGKKAATKQFDKIMTNAFSAGATGLILDAKAAYKAKDFDQAAIKVAEARNIQSSVKVKLSRRTRGSLKRLTRQLGPRVANAERQLVNPNLGTSGEAPTAPGLEAASAANKKTMKSGNTSEQVMLSAGSR